MLDTNVYELSRRLYPDAWSIPLSLEQAFEPEQPFENPDGTPIQFDADYFGSHRGVDVVPGPFADSADAKKSLYE